jgi:hypothetical protein
MNLINNLKIRTKLMSAFGIMVVFMGVIGITGYRSMKGIQTDLENIFSVQMPSDRSRPRPAATAGGRAFHDVHRSRFGAVQTIR